MNARYIQNNIIIYLNHHSNHFYICHKYDPKYYPKHSNIFYLTSFGGHRHLFQTTLLPYWDQKIKNSKPVFVIQGNLENDRRRFHLLTKIFTHSFEYDFEIRMIGKGQIPKILLPFQNKFTYYLNLDFESFHEKFRDVYCILPLVSKKDNIQYYTKKITSSINYAKGYHLLCLLEKDLQETYNLIETEVYENDDDFLEKFKICLYKFYFPKKKIIELFYYHDYSSKYGNFEDVLNLFLFQQLINPLKYKLIFKNQDSQKNYDRMIDYRLYGIGSIFHFIVDDCFIFGSGIRTDNYNVSSLKNINILSLRGPKTFQKLLNLGYNIENVPYGDPALLLPLYYQPKKIKLEKSYIFIPHKSQIKYYIQNKESIPKNILMISPYEHWENVINHIYSCQGVISESLHGLICADAYNIPNLWFKNALPEGEFKFLDYFESQLRNTQYIMKWESFSSDLFYRDGNQIDIQLLKSTFPFY